MNKSIVMDVHERPRPLQWLMLSVQHLFAMFGATILVPVLTGLNPAVALLSSGIGTLTYLIITRGKIPAYLGFLLRFHRPDHYRVPGGGNRCGPVRLLPGRTGLRPGLPLDLPVRCGLAPPSAAAGGDRIGGDRDRSRSGRGGRRYGQYGAGDPGIAENRGRVSRPARHRGKRGCEGGDGH